jgi:hypothetical protein
MPCHVILNQAAHDDKPPVVHGNKRKNVSYCFLGQNKRNVFFAYAMLNIICFYVFMFSGMLHCLDFIKSGIL